MNFRGERKSFRLAILGYQYEAAQSYYDLNWLKIRIDAKDHDLSWSATDCCLLTFELVRLRDWIDSIFDSTEDSSLYFFENEIAFRYESRKKSLAVVLDFHLHPKGDNYIYGPDGDKEHIISFDATDEVLFGLIKQIDEMIEPFPERKKKGGK